MKPPIPMALLIGPPPWPDISDRALDELLKSLAAWHYSIIEVEHCRRLIRDTIEDDIDSDLRGAWLLIDLCGKRLPLGRSMDRVPCYNTDEVEDLIWTELKRRGLRL